MELIKILISSWQDSVSIGENVSDMEETGTYKIVQIIKVENKFSDTIIHALGVPTERIEE